MNKNVVAIILARGGSKGIPRKNLVNFSGEPLIFWTLNQVRDSGVSKIFVSTDDQEIADFVYQNGASVIERPSALAADGSSSDEALMHAVDYLEIPNEFIVTMPQITSPLRKPEHIVESINLVLSGKYDSVFSGVQIDDICVWRSNGQVTSLTYDHENRVRRQDRPQMIVENGSIYSMTAECLRLSKNRLGGRIGFSIMPKWTLSEIDDLEDLKLCEALAAIYMR